MDDYCFKCMGKLNSELVCTCCGEKKTDRKIPPHHLMPGTILSNRYLVGNSIGEGGFGITYVGLDTKLDMKIAIKEYYPYGFVNRNNVMDLTVETISAGEKEQFFDKGKDKFIKEAKILAKFSGEDGIVDVRDYFQENNTAYIIMEYLDGETLKTYIGKRGKIPAEEVVSLLMPVMKALRKIHNQDLIHRDISPDNIMITNDKVKLLDFGAARNVTSDENTSLSVIYKQGYAPEEQHRSRGIQGPWTDVYALCATMYKCITGITPDDSAQRVYQDEVKAPSALR